MFAFISLIFFVITLSFLYLFESSFLKKLVWIMAYQSFNIFKRQTPDFIDIFFFWSVFYLFGL